MMVDVHAVRGRRDWGGNSSSAVAARIRCTSTRLRCTRCLAAAAAVAGPDAPPYRAMSEGWMTTADRHLLFLDDRWWVGRGVGRSSPSGRRTLPLAFTTANQGPTVYPKAGGYIESLFVYLVNTGSQGGGSFQETDGLGEDVQGCEEGRALRRDGVC